jgi:4-hydroxy-tetrahydrodipicolinate reductase
VRVLLFGREGKVGSVVGPSLREAGHEVTGVEAGEEPRLEGQDAAVDFTAPGAVLGNMRLALAAGVPGVVGTSGLTDEGLAELDRLARDSGVPCLVVPNFALGAVLMMRFAEEAARVMPRAEIVELHHDTKVDAPSGTAKATAARMGGDVAIHSVRLPGLVAHQEVILGAAGQTLVIRHDTTSREAFVPGVLLALERLDQLPAGLTIGLDTLLG